MAEKSGYEIRSDLLHLAHRIVSDDAHMKYEASKRIVHDGEATYEHREWNSFSVEQVLEVAEKLNTFVTQKK